MLSVFRWLYSLNESVCLVMYFWVWLYRVFCVLIFDLELVVRIRDLSLGLL